MTAVGRGYAMKSASLGVLLALLVGGAFVGGYSLGHYEGKPRRRRVTQSVGPTAPQSPSPYQLALDAATKGSDAAHKAFDKNDWPAAARQFSLAANNALIAGREQLAQECFYNAGLAWERTGDWDAAFYSMERAGNLKGYLRERARGMADKVRYKRWSAPPLP